MCVKMCVRVNIGNPFQTPYLTPYLFEEIDMPREGISFVARVAINVVSYSRWNESNI